jgi:hypothetical protein
MFTAEFQLHDYSPLIDENRVFWAVPIPDDSVTINPGTGEATMRLTDFAVPDAFHYDNSLLLSLLPTDPPLPDAIPAVPATISFEVTWAGGGERARYSSDVDRFETNLMENTATVTWSSHQADFSFVSDAAPETQTTLYAAVGRERNGVFFP